MKNSLRNFALGAALAVGSMAVAPQAFAQESPVTTVFNRTVTSADFDGVSMGEIRCATGVNGVVYALDKSTGKIWAITADATEVYATVDVNHGENPDKADDPNHVTTAITSDDAGNLVVSYAKGNFFAAALYSFAIIPADGSDVIYTDPVTLPDGFTINRCDVIGRIVGDVLSDEGAYMYISGNGSVKSVACYYISNGVFTPEEYPSDPYLTDMANMNAVVPMYNTMAEQMEVDPLYNGAVFFPWNGSGPELFNSDGEAVRAGRPADLAYSAVPGGDVINYGGKTYYAVNYTRISGKRTGDFVIYDQDLNIIFKTENTATDDYIGGAFLNGGAIVVHPSGEGKFQLHFWGGPQSQVVASVYEINLAGETPAEPGSIYLVGAPSGWVAPSEDSAAHYEAWKLTETAAGTGVYTGSFTIPAGKAMFRFYSELTGWDAGASLGYENSERNVDCAFTDNAFTGPIVAGKANYSFPAWEGGVMDITVDLNAGTVSIAATPMFIAPDLYVRGDFNSWDATKETLMSKVQNSAESCKYSITLPTLAGEFKLSTADWTTSFGAPITTTLEISEAGEYDVFENGGNLVFNIADTKDIVIELVITRNFSTEASKLTISWTSGVADLVVDQEAARFFNLQGIEVPADQLTTGVYVKLQGSKATKVTVK